MDNDKVAQHVREQKDIICKYEVEIDILKKKILLLEEDLLQEDLKRKDREYKETPYHNFVRGKSLELQSTGRTVMENMSLIAKEWKNLDTSEKLKYNF